MKEHTLKTDPQHFENLINGSKTFELRLNDRNFQAGETLMLLEFDRNDFTYSGRSLRYAITHILFDYPGLHEDYVIMSIQRINKV